MDVPSAEYLFKFASNEASKKTHYKLARFTANTFADSGDELLKVSIIGRESKRGSATNDASYEAETVSIVLRISAQLISASADLFSDGRNYAAAALLRQMVEVEYLAWAVDQREQDAKLWIQSNPRKRQSMFSAARLRKAADGKFRGRDYKFHCEFGGHPTPDGATSLLNDEQNGIKQILLVDLLGHAGRIWDHLVRWAKRNPNGAPILQRNKQMVARFSAWKSQDPLSALPPPPLNKKGKIAKTSK